MAKEKVPRSQAPGGGRKALTDGSGSHLRSEPLTRAGRDQAGEDPGSDSFRPEPGEDAPLMLAAPSFSLSTRPGGDDSGAVAEEAAPSAEPAFTP